MNRSHILESAALDADAARARVNKHGADIIEHAHIIEHAIPPALDEHAAAVLIEYAARISAAAAVLGNLADIGGDIRAAARAAHTAADNTSAADARRVRIERTKEVGQSLLDAECKEATSSSLRAAAAAADSARAAAASTSAAASMLEQIAASMERGAAAAAAAAAADAGGDHRAAAADARRRIAAARISIRPPSIRPPKE